MDELNYIVRIWTPSSSYSKKLRKCLRRIENKTKKTLLVWFYATISKHYVGLTLIFERCNHFL